MGPEFERAALPKLLAQFRAEFNEMPGMCLTADQASRLWNVDRSMCLHALDRLVGEGFLSTGRLGYRRAA
jgi:hypothetical protein